MTYSRRRTIEEKSNRRKAMGFTLLSIGFVLFMFFYGLPLLVKLANIAYDFKKGSEAIEINDSTPPPPPRFDTLPEFTSDKSIEIQGGSESGSIVAISINGKVEEVISDNEGKFSTRIDMTIGQNLIKAYASDSMGNKSQETPTYIVTFDNEPPDIKIISPENNSEHYGSMQKTLIIKGITEAGTQVQINDRLAIVDSNGNFNFSTQLSSGSNSFMIKSTDQAGNITETNLQVTYSP